MALIMLLIIILIFAMLLAISIKYKKKIILYVVFGIIGIAGLTWILNHTIFYYNNDKVEIERLLGNYDNFNIKIKSHKIKFNGTAVSFSCEYSIDDLLTKIKEQYSNAYIDDKFHEIVIVYDNELFTICYREDNSDKDADYLWFKRYEYILSSDAIDFEDKIDNRTLDYIQIPFPTIALNESSLLIKEDMLIRCDFEYLKTYYKDFTNVKLEDNKIEITINNYIFTITPNGNYAHFEVERK